MGWTIWVEKREIRVRGQTYNWKEDLKAAGFRFRKVGFDPEWWRPTPQDPKEIIGVIDAASKNVPEGFRITMVAGGREVTSLVTIASSGSPRCRTAALSQ